MNKGALQAVRRCKATIVNCGTEQREVSPMRAKEAAQPVAAIAADEPSEAGSTASELANIGGPKG